MVTLQTERLKLRMWRDEDLDVYASFCGDREVMRHIGDGKTLSRENSWRQMAAMAGHWSLRGYGIWAVEELATQRLVGRIGLYNPEGWPGLELGWLLGKEYWGHGYATEGARCALDFVFEQMKRDEIISLIHPYNEASKRVAKRLGQQLTDECRVGGQSVLVYGINRQQWRGEEVSAIKSA